jgi:hypothetical protein
MGSVSHRPSCCTKFAQLRFPVKWRTQKDTRWLVCDASSALKAEWWSIRMYSFYRRWNLESLTIPESARLILWPGSILILKPKISRQGSLQGWLRILQFLRSCGGWFQTSRFNNKWSCSSGNERNSGSPFGKRDRDDRRNSSCARQCSTWQCCIMIFLTYKVKVCALDLLRLGNFSAATIQSWCTLSDLQLIPKMEEHFPSNEISKMKSRNGYVSRTHDNKCLNRLVDKVA